MGQDQTWKSDIFQLFLWYFLPCVQKLIATNMTAEYIVSQTISCTSTDDLRWGTPQTNNDISTLETLSR